MLFLLPPSETKRAGGAGAPLDMSTLSFADLAPLRTELAERLVALSADDDAAMRALKLGPRLIGEIGHNRALWTSATMPALDRFTGVLFDALDAETLDSSARAFAADTVFVHSALFGLVGALDPIPAYRLSHDSRIPGVALKRFWRDSIAQRIASHEGLVVDLRSEAYAELGPAPVRDGSVFVRVVAIDDGGRKRALNHFNKQAKGRFTRRLLETRPQLESTDDLVQWAGAEGFRMALGAAPAGAQVELDLVA
ncbi:YaaA family protein [Agromyces allii]|uniref:Peroxide stress protein YaaA n=1 Tax=Agromyces allii TaxID=393607 RepID=A0ABP5BHS4_9MICO|nr:peroxide stress protein YaaA [Agromyces allii]